MIVSEVSSAFRSITQRLLDYAFNDQPEGGQRDSHGSLSVVVTAARWIWKPDAPLSEQVDLLRQRTHDLQDGLVTLRNDHAARIEGVQRDVTAQLDRQRETIDQQAHEAVENEQRAVRLDQDGLPLIAAGIVLTGLPDVWLTPIVAGLLLAGSVLLCLRWARRARRSRETEVHP